MQIFALKKPDKQHFRVSGNSWLAISGEPGNVLGSAHIKIYLVENGV